MDRPLAILALVAAVTWSALAWAGVTDGTAAAVPTYHERGASELPALGPLAPSLQGKPVVVRIHADWCLACKATQATLDQLVKSYAGRINFIEFDVTDGKTAAAAQAQAKQLGLAKYFEATKAATSTVGVIDPRDGKVYGAFYNDGQLGDYKAAIEDALRSGLE